jgi:hypothetical protein
MEVVVTLHRPVLRFQGHGGGAKSNISPSL